LIFYFMEGWIYGIYGGFWDWKTLGAVMLIVSKLKSWEVVFSNIRLDKKYLPNPDNYYFFSDMDDFHDILNFSGLFAMKASEFSDSEVKKGYPAYPRGMRPRINIFFDEMGIFANSKDFAKIHSKYWASLQQYILQMRKLFVSTYLIIQRPNQLVSDLRIHIAGWIKFKPLFDSDLFQKYAWKYYLQELDPITFKVVTETKMSYDSSWTLFSYDVPQELVLFKVWYKPRYYKYYDDLYLNQTFETSFHSNYLFDSGLFDNIKAWRINNKCLLNNKKIYANYFKDSNDSNKGFILPKVDFINNPSYWFHLFICKLKVFFTRKYYIKDIYLILKNYVFFLVTKLYVK